jgi:hypothetical protein
MSEEKNCTKKIIWKESVFFLSIWERKEKLYLEIK